MYKSKLLSKRQPVSKRDVAMAYFPDLKYTAAKRKFERYVHDNPYIMNELKKRNYKIFSKKLSVSQLRVIFRFLGEP